jgi:hypothetical protein
LLDDFWSFATTMFSDFFHPGRWEVFEWNEITSYFWWYPHLNSLGRDTGNILLARWMLALILVYFSSGWSYFLAENTQDDSDPPCQSQVHSTRYISFCNLFPIWGFYFAFSFISMRHQSTHPNIRQGGSLLPNRKIRTDHWRNSFKLK